jgi:hypothetical protein
MRVSSIIREYLGLKPLNRIKIVIIQGNSKPIIKGNSFGRDKNKYIPTQQCIEVGQDWVLGLDFSVKFEPITNEKV